MGTLHPSQLNIIREHNWFNLFVPRTIGGLEYDLPEGVRLLEQLAYADGSLGWVVTLCGGAAWFVGFLDQALVNTIYSDNHSCFAGSGSVSGIALAIDNGYLVNGIWRYASGSLFATVFTANCRLEDTNEIRSFLFFCPEVTIHRTWNAMGMIATGSHTFEVRNMLTSANRCFEIKPEAAVLSQAIYQFPFLQFAESTLAVNISGMAMRFLELAGASQTDLADSRQTFYEALDKAWNDINNPLHLQSLSGASRSLAHFARQMVDKTYPKCGMLASDLSTEINRVWRNLHTASQHTLLG
ncbi:MAG TPA: hypothetical protein VKR32_09940 [Puia sp.]|nr:hypothetical protein [Puia sp.]